MCETVLKSELFLYNGVDIDWQFEGNVSNTSGESVPSKQNQIVKTVFFTICSFCVIIITSTTDNATMPCSAALIREEPCQCVRHINSCGLFSSFW